MNNLKFLECWSTTDLKSKTKIRCQIENARSAFLRKKNLLIDPVVSFNFRFRFVKTYTHSILGIVKRLPKAHLQSEKIWVPNIDNEGESRGQTKMLKAEKFEGLHCSKFTGNRTICRNCSQTLWQRRLKLANNFLENVEISRLLEILTILRLLYCLGTFSSFTFGTEGHVCSGKQCFKLSNSQTWERILVICFRFSCFVCDGSYFLSISQSIISQFSSYSIYHDHKSNKAPLETTEYCFIKHKILFSSNLFKKIPYFYDNMRNENFVAIHLY